MPRRDRLSPLDGLTELEKARYAGRLRRYQRLTDQQIAAKLEVPLGTVRRLLATYDKHHGDEPRDAARLKILNMY